MINRSIKPHFDKKHHLAALVSMLAISGLYFGCASSSVEKEIPPPIEVFHSLENLSSVKKLGAVSVEVAVNPGHSSDVVPALMSKAQAKGGNGIIDIVLKQGNNGKKKNGKEIWSGTATAVQISGENYLQLFNTASKSNDRVYGVGTAKLADLTLSLSVAETRAKAAIARAYGSTVTTVSGKTRETITNASIENSTIEQRKTSSDGTVWILLSVKRDDVQPR